MTNLNDARQFALLLSVVVLSGCGVAPGEDLKAESAIAETRPVVGHVSDEDMAQYKRDHGTINPVPTNQVAEWARDHANQELTPEQKQALIDYSSDFYWDINSVLRVGGLSEDSSHSLSDIQIRIDRIRSSFYAKGTTLTNPVRVYRGFRCKDPCLNEAQPGDVFLPAGGGFVSTTLSERIAREHYAHGDRERNLVPHVVAIDLPAGTKFVWMEPFTRNQDEFEILLPSEIKAVVLETHRVAADPHEAYPERVDLVARAIE